MKKNFTAWCTCIFVFAMSIFPANKSDAQTAIRGFMDFNTIYAKDKLSFNLGEEDLFITSEISDRINFLGETVFKYSASSPTLFDVSIERAVIKFNYSGNHNLLLGKHHTPINYWNDTYHHGRVFFPTISRPLLFSQGIIPLHTTGISFNGQNLGHLKFGYDVMAGNGLGSGDLEDNDNFKSVTTSIHIKPFQFFRAGISYYYDVISKGAVSHHSATTSTTDMEIRQQLMTGSVSYFGKKFEILCEATFAINHTDSTGNANTVAAYGYTGYRLFKKLVPYVRVDYLKFDNKELYFHNDNTFSVLGGIRLEINYLTVVKLEYQSTNFDVAKNTNIVSAQFALGF